MKVMVASKARELSNKYHKSQTEVTHEVIKKNLSKVFNDTIKDFAKLGRQDLGITTIIDNLVMTSKSTLNRPLIEEAVKKLAVDNEYRIVASTIYW